MPVRLPPLTERPARILLEGLVDYAGLYPPAALTMPAAVRNYAHYRAGGSGWVLGRFVCPATALETFSELADPLLPRDAGAIPWRLSVTGSGDVAADMTAIAAFNERHRVCFDECGAIVDCYELKAETPDDVARIHASVPRELLTYIEVPLDDRVHDLVAAVALTGRRAKMRAGGTTSAAFPAASRVVTFLRACLEHQVTAKATAGLHHPLRGSYRLTYEPDAPTGRMFGFFNVLLAAGVLAAGGTDAQAIGVLEESNAEQIVMGDADVQWQGEHGDLRLDRQTLQRVREQMLVGVGSCSFTEPVDESRALGWL
ncbi:MAG TPA: hypothetical protein DGD08_01635 [Gemmatimonas aurantiaca]|uniref:Uncharacterized protein n=2 Tax=Gemmatimonas aurantiaca TaxID=173480 RepID=C1A5G9_GEMAT|nr:hypothetical protein [Gemmatimonas aurantiaca]BAH37479.1 hypothetical protein GAU_0437 [Gemmatimonas aurantiaca T-27]HCT55894.1 hypothetical protein [Gemmatimonas aurantiaca]